MWDRKELKARGKAAFKANYWRCVLMAFILLLVAGQGSGSSGITVTQNINSFKTLNEISNQDTYNDFDEFEDLQDSFDDGTFDSPTIDDFEEGYDANEDIDADLDDIIGELPSGGGNDMALLLGGLFVGFMIVFTIILVIGIVVDAFIMNPLELGIRKFFLSNSEGNSDIGLIGYAFSNNYSNVIKVMFFRDIFIALWSLLFIIPGVIKMYEYRMVPYLLSLNPNMDRKEALQTSRNMMYGQKMDAFILDLSFIGWYLLSACTLGILGIFYVDPYKAATEAELYKAIAGTQPELGYAGAQAGAANYAPGYDPQQGGYNVQQGGYNAQQDGAYGGSAEQMREDDVYMNFEMPAAAPTVDPAAEVTEAAPAAEPIAEPAAEVTDAAPAAAPTVDPAAEVTEAAPAAAPTVEPVAAPTDATADTTDTEIE